MQVKVRHSYEPVYPDAELSVFIDVFRASTTLCSLFHAGAAEVIGINDYPTIKQYLDQGYLLVSEVFDDGMDNSPTQVLKMDLNDRRVLLKTGNLITAIFNNLEFNQALVCGFVNIDAVVEEIRRRSPSLVEIVAASYYDAKNVAVEDLSCALALEQLLGGKQLGGLPEYPLLTELENKIALKKSKPNPYGDHYIDDLHFALQRGRFDYVPAVTKLNECVVRFQTSSPAP